MTILLMIPPILVLVCMVRCYKKESKVTGLYEYFGVYNRLYAIITVCLLCGSVGILIERVYTIVSDRSGASIVMKLLALLLGVASSGVTFILGRYLYRKARARCPEALKKKLLLSMFITGFGTGMKLMVFFLPHVWKLIEPKEILLDGQPALSFGGNAYTPSGELLGPIRDNKVSIRR